jgi:hypothetical protein
LVASALYKALLLYEAHLKMYKNDEDDVAENWGERENEIWRFPQFAVGIS